MSMSLKAQALASVALLGSAELERDLIRTMARIVFGLVRPASYAAVRLGCACPSTRQLLGNCPYHGNMARRLIHG